MLWSESHLWSQFVSIMNFVVKESNNLHQNYLGYEWKEEYIHYFCRIWPIYNCFRSGFSITECPSIRNFSVCCYNGGYSKGACWSIAQGQENRGFTSWIWIDVHISNLGLTVTQECPSSSLAESYTSMAFKMLLLLQGVRLAVRKKGIWLWSAGYISSFNSSNRVPISSATKKSSAVLTIANSLRHSLHSLLFHQTHEGNGQSFALKGERWHLDSRSDVLREVLTNFI